MDEEEEEQEEADRSAWTGGGVSEFIYILQYSNFVISVLDLGFSSFVFLVLGSVLCMLVDFCTVVLGM